MLCPSTSCRFIAHSGWRLQEEPLTLAVPGNTGLGAQSGRWLFQGTQGQGHSQGQGCGASDGCRWVGRQMRAVLSSLETGSLSSLKQAKGGLILERHY